MSSRVLVVHPIGTDIYNDYTLDLLGPSVGPATDLEVRNLEGVSDSTFVLSPESVQGALVAAVQEAEEDGISGVVVACASDPGVHELKKVVNIPVTGPFEALANTVPALGRLTIIAAAYRIDTWAPRANAYGLKEALASVREADFSHPDPDTSDRLLREDPAQLRCLILAELARSVNEDGVVQARLASTEDKADAVFFACTLWSGLLDVVQKELPDTKVLDPLLMPIRYLEYLLDLG